MNPSLTPEETFSQFNEVIESLKEEVSDIKNRLDGSGFGNKEIVSKNEKTDNVNSKIFFHFF